MRISGEIMENAEALFQKVYELESTSDLHPRLQSQEKEASWVDRVTGDSPQNGQSFTR